jgi:hypothetical protein
VDRGRPGRTAHDKRVVGPREHVDPDGQIDVQRSALGDRAECDGEERVGGGRVPRRDGEAPGRAEDATNLGEHGSMIGEVRHPEGRHDGIEGAVLERHLLR